MKRRISLVSNSSSSSFILFGFQVNMTPRELVKKITEQEELDEDYIWDSLYNGMELPGSKLKIVGYPSDDTGYKGIILGVVPMLLSDNDVRDMPMDFSEIEKALDLVAKKLNLSNLKRRLFGGTIPT